MVGSFLMINKQTLTVVMDAGAENAINISLYFQSCDDMFIYSKWNGSTTYTHGENKRDFGTDYGICCWYTPQLNFRYGYILVSSKVSGKRVTILFLF